MEMLSGPALRRADSAKERGAWPREPYLHNTVGGVLRRLISMIWAEPRFFGGGAGRVRVDCGGKKDGG